MKKIAIYLLIVLAGIVSSGCATTTRTASGVAATAYGFGTGVAKIAKIQPTRS